MVAWALPRPLKVTAVQLDVPRRKSKSRTCADDVSGVSERAPQNAASSADQSIPEVPVCDKCGLRRL